MFCNVSAEIIYVICTRGKPHSDTIMTTTHFLCLNDVLWRRVLPLKLSRSHTRSQDENQNIGPNSAKSTSIANMHCTLPVERSELPMPKQGMYSEGKFKGKLTRGCPYSNIQIIIMHWSTHIRNNGCAGSGVQTILMILKIRIGTCHDTTNDSVQGVNLSVNESARQRCTKDKSTVAQFVSVSW